MSLFSQLDSAGLSVTFTVHGSGVAYKPLGTGLWSKLTAVVFAESSQRVRDEEQLQVEIARKLEVLICTDTSSSFGGVRSPAIGDLMLINGELWVVSQVLEKDAISARLEVEASGPVDKSDLVNV